MSCGTWTRLTTPPDVGGYHPAMTMQPAVPPSRWAPLDTPAQTPGMPDGGGIMAGITLAIGKINSTHDRLCDALDKASARAALLPNQIPLSIAGAVPSPAGPFVIDLGGPQPGRVWMVRQLAVSDGNSVRAAVAGTVTTDWYVGKPPGGVLGASNVIGPNQWVAATGAPPTIQPFSSEQIKVGPQNHLFVVITGATTVGQSLLATAIILDAPAGAFDPTFNL
jgi:hypothetical protein